MGNPVRNEVLSWGNGAAVQVRTSAGSSSYVMHKKKVIYIARVIKSYIAGRWCSVRSACRRQCVGEPQVQVEIERVGRQVRIEENREGMVGMLVAGYATAAAAACCRQTSSSSSSSKQWSSICWYR